MVSVVHKNGSEIFTQINHEGGAAKVSETELLVPSVCADKC